MKTFTHLPFSFVLLIVALLGFASMADAQTGKVALFQDGPNATRFTGTVPRFYLNPAEVQSSGVQVEMVIADLESSSIDEYGIIWSDNARPDYYKNSGRQALSMPMTEGNHTYLIKGLQQNKAYYAYGYVVIEGVLFISNEISFENSMLAAGMKKAASRAPRAVTGCGTVSGETVFLDEDNENNAGTGVADNDLGILLYNYDSLHPIEVNVEVNQVPQMDAFLAIYAYDVDEEPNSSGLREVDGVYFNGTRVGALSGNNGAWNTTTFRIPKESIKKGKNLVQVKVDELDEGWQVQVKWVQLLVNGGVGDKASIGELTINTAEKSGSTVNVKIAADIKVCNPSSFAIETNLIAPDKSNVHTAKTVFSASSDVDNKELNLQLPLGSMTGTYTANFYLFDNTAGVMLHSASIHIDHTKNVGVDPLVVAITPSTEIETENPVILTCKAKSVIPSQATITGVQAPGASAHNGKPEALYTAKRNGAYTFKVYYTEGGTAKTKDFTYTVANIVLKTQTITWNQTFTDVKVDVPVTLSATASSGLSVKFSIPQTANATLVGNVLTFKKANQTVAVTVSQDGGSGYDTASPIAKQIKAAKGSSENVEFPSIGGGIGGSSDPVVAGDVITFPTKTDDGRDIVYTITPAGAGTQKTENGKVVITIDKAGEATITATIAPTADYEEIKKEFPVTVAKGNQTITWTDDLSTVQVSKPMRLTAKSSVATMVVTYESSDASIATITESNLLTVLQANKDVVIRAMQKGNANYNPATVVEKTVKAAKGENTIAWDQTFTDVKVDEPIELPALTSTAGMNVVYSSSDPSIATITQKDGKTYLTFLQFNKEVKVIATAGTGVADYEEAKVEKAVTATKKGSKPNVEFPNISGEAGGGTQPEGKPSVDKSYEYPAQTSDGRDIIYTINPADAATQTKKDDKVIISLDKAGDITITATIEETPDYEKFETVISVKVEKANQTITWTQNLSALQVNVPVSLNAVSDKGLPITYKSSDETAATISGVELTVLKYNTEVTVTATQAGNDDYNAAQEVSLKAKATQKGDPSTDADYPVIEEGPNAPKVDESIVFPAQTNDGRDIVYTITPSTAGTQTTENGKVMITITEAVDVKVTATIQGGADYEDVVKEFPIKTQKGTQTITWTQNLSALQVNVPVSLNAVSDKGLPILYRSQDTSVATIDGNSLKILKYNTEVEITATQAGDKNYNAAQEVKLTAKATLQGSHAITWDQTLDRVKVGETIELTAVSSEKLPVTYESANTEVATVENNRLTFHKYDVEVVITAKSANDHFAEAKATKTWKANVKGSPSVDADYPAIEEGEKAPRPGDELVFPGKTDDGKDIIYEISPVGAATQEKKDDKVIITIEKNTEVTIEAIVKGDGVDTEDNIKEIVIGINQKGAQTLTWDQTISDLTVGDKLLLTATTTSGRSIAYILSDPTCGKITTDSYLILAKEMVSVTLTAVVNEDDDYLASNQLEKTFAIKPLVIDDNKDLGELVIPEGLEEEVIVTVTETGNVKLSSSDNEEKTIKQLVINQKDNEVGSVYTDDQTKIYPSVLTLKAEFTPGKWHFISMPFDTDLSNLDLKYSEDYAIAYYDVEQRAQNKRDNWKVLSNATVLKAGQGYLIRVMKENLVFNFSTNEQALIKETFTFGDIDKPLTHADNEGKASAYNSGWNFVGIPYLSEYLAEPSDKILYVYDEEEQNYVVVSKDMDVQSMVLRPWSAFLLQSGSADDALKFIADNRIAPGSRAMAYARERVSSDKQRFVFELRTDGKVDRTFVMLDPDARKEYVINEDAAKFFSMQAEHPQIYTLAGEGSVALNKLPEQEAQTLIDLIASATANKECELVLTEKPDEYKDVVLSSSLGQVKLEKNEPYVFTSVGENRFKLMVSRGTVNIGENELNSVSVYTTHSNLVMKNLPCGVTLRISSIAGKLIYMDSPLSEESSYELPEHGVYLVTLSVNGIDKVFKVIY